MKRITPVVVAATLLLGGASARAAEPKKPKPTTGATMSSSSSSPSSSASIMLAPWTGPNGGWPAFAQVKIADFPAAFDAAMATNLKEVEAIANQTTPATFDNTTLALERAGQDLTRVRVLWGVWTSNLMTDELKPLQSAIEPKLAAFQDTIFQNAKLFARVAAVYDARESAKLTPEQQRLTWVHWNAFVRAGARLDDKSKARVAVINERLATLFATFGQNLQGDEDTAIFLKKVDLAGLSPSFIDGAAAAADERGHKGAYAVTNTRSSMDPFLSTSERRDLREKVWRTYYSRGDNGDARDNNKLISEILGLRAERAKLLGYATHAHWRLADKMAKSPDTAMALMMQVWPSAIARVREEVKDMQALADADAAANKTKPFKIEAWDYRYFAEKVRKAKYDLDENDVKPFLALDKVKAAMFWQAGQLFGLTFTQVKDAPVFHADVEVWQVKDQQGAHVAYWWFDPYARSGKNSGAWEMAYRSQDKIHDRHNGKTPVLVSNNSNFVKGKPGEPVLVSWDDVTTMFHEFGHALHEMLSDVTYPSLAGTATATDFVEFPSQVNESWASTPEVLNKFLTNAKGEPMPQALVDKIKKSQTFNTGFDVTEYLAAALVDMKLHLASTPGTKIDPDKFERETLAALGMPAEVVMRHRTPQFRHVFGGDDYSAGYYSYLWSEVLAHDAFGAFTEAGGPYDKAVAGRFQKTIMSVGNTVDPADAYRTFRGRDPKIDAYLKAKGFPPPAK